AAALCAGAEDAEQPSLVARQNLDGLALETIALDVPTLELRDARKHAVADTDRGLAVSLGLAEGKQEHARRRAVRFLPLDRRRNEVAVIVPADDLERGDGGQAALLLQALAVA